MADFPAARPIRLPRALTPLRHRDFRLLVIGQVTSNVGDACYAVALPWYVLATHGGAVLLGTVLAAYGIPRTALIAFGGYASDRWRPQTVMLLTDITRALVIGALALAAGLGPARAEVLVPLAIVIGAGEGLFLPASFSVVPSLLSGDDLGPGNALSSSGTQLATLIGPGVGGVLVAIAGPSFAFALDAATFAVSALTLYAMRVPRAATIPPAVLTSFGIFPLSVAIAAVFVRDLGPAPFFLFAAATLAAAILAGLSQRAWRDFGASQEPAPVPLADEVAQSQA